MTRARKDDSRLGKKYVTKPWAVAPRGRSVINNEGY